MYRKQLLALAGIAGGAGLLLAAPAASATTVTIGSCEGTAAFCSSPANVTTVQTGVTGAGFANFTGVFGAWTFNNVSGYGSPILVGNEIADSTSYNVSSLTSGTLNVFVTVSGITTPIGTALSLLSAFTADSSSTGITSVTESTFYNTSNALFSGTALGSELFTTVGSSVSNNQYDPATIVTSPYSITEEFTIVASGVGNSSATIDVSSTPLPGALSLFGGGLGVLGLLARRKKRKGVTGVSAIA